MVVRSDRRAAWEGKKCRNRYSSIDSDTVTVFKLRLEVEVLSVFALVAVLSDGAILAEK